MKRMRYVYFSHVCVLLDISKELLENIKLSWHDEEWIQPINYEYIPFRCHRCHEHGHLFRQCPLNAPIQDPNQKGRERDEDNFEKVRQRRKTTKKNLNQEQSQPQMKNRFDILQEELEGNKEGTLQEIPQGISKTTEQEIKGSKSSDDRPHACNEVGGGNGEDMELGELDLEGIEKACENLQEGYIPF